MSNRDGPIRVSQTVVSETTTLCDSSNWINLGGSWPLGSVPMSALGLPADYWRLWSSSTLANVGDGIREAALPLVAAAISRDPALVAGVAVAQRLPWLVFGLPAGVIVDRMDPRWIAAAANWTRSVALLVLAAALMLGQAEWWLLLAVALCLGAGEVFADSVAVVAIPAIVADDRLPRANSLMASGQIVANEFVGPPLGAGLFLLGAAVPIAADAGALAIAGALLLTLPVSVAGADAVNVERPAAALRTGLQFVRRSVLLTRLLVATTVLSLVDAAWFALLALFVLDVLNLGAGAFGALLAVGGIGGLLGSVAADRLGSRQVPARVQLSGALVVTAVTQVVLGLTSSVVVVGVMLALSSGAFAIYNVAAVTVRQRVTPHGMLGRVTTISRTVVLGGAVVGAAAGGVIAEAAGLRAPLLALAPFVLMAAGVAYRIDPEATPTTS